MRKRNAVEVEAYAFIRDDEAQPINLNLDVIVWDLQAPTILHLQSAHYHLSVDETKIVVAQLQKTISFLEV